MRRYSYSQDYTPPAPALEITVSLPGEPGGIGPLTAMVDTGADGTLIPTPYLQQIAAPVVAEMRLRSHWGEFRPVYLYAVDIRLDYLTMPGIYVVGDDQGDEIILGRNVLNHLRLLLDGPAGMIEL